ncbi:MAG: hypothetical protein EHM24_24820, partial [Acidobacteria bacterium]
VVHGGIVSALLDEVMVWSAFYTTGSHAVTAELTVRFVRPVRVEGCLGEEKMRRGQRRIDLERAARGGERLRPVLSGQHGGHAEVRGGPFAVLFEGDLEGAACFSPLELLGQHLAPRRLGSRIAWSCGRRSAEQAVGNLDLAQRPGSPGGPQVAVRGGCAFTSRLRLGNADEDRLRIALPAAKLEEETVFQRSLALGLALCRGFHD